MDGFDFFIYGREVDGVGLMVILLKYAVCMIHF